MVATSLLAILDIVALGLLALAMPAMANPDVGVTLPLFGELDGERDMILLIAVVAALIASKSILNLLLLRYATSRFAAHEVAIGDRLLAAYMRAPWAERLGMNSNEIVRSVDSGVATSVSGVLIPSMSLAGEMVSVASVVLVLAVAQPLTAAITIVYLGLVVLILSQVISKRAVANGRRNRAHSMITVRLVSEAIATLKELTLRGATGQIQRVVHDNRVKSAHARAMATFYSNVPRYVLEAGLVGGFLLIGIASYVDGGLAGAVAAVALFAVAGFRLVPSLTRFQAILSQVHSNTPFAEQTVRDITRAEARASELVVDQRDLAPGAHDIELRHVTYRYPNAEEPALRDVSLTIPAGSRVALVGSSGAGKSTLVDLLLGLLQPTAGEVLVGGVPLPEVLASWRSRVGYVPQEVALFDASVAQNVALSWDDAGVDRDKVHRALRRAQLEDALAHRDGGIDAKVAERGMALSGGQRQRMGIARALYNDPTVLVLDEATSALDTATEDSVTHAIHDLDDVTTVTVAHRLSTIKDSDTVFFFDHARLISSGTFADVVGASPDFARQAQLAGLA
ncbi:ABC transporter ATP-binding protein/permease [Georgenia sp. SYP-B2076]|uniref:ATP-binding cassette domain-containing protein n=1 Tax=Georgenia sp. SYP-B2076 TaxID=2495881 RepID=UPI001F0C4737|nr:ABC transporter ATP-binding protein/permease [Georgenia sp. SYP-B2076]